MPSEPPPLWAFLVASTSVGACITAVITLVNVNRLKRIEFKYDYRKYILGKRKGAYDKIEAVIANYVFVNSDIELSNPFDSEAYARAFCTRIKAFHKFVLKAITQYMWLPPEMNTILSTIKRIVESSLKAIEIEFPHANPEHEVYQKARKLPAVNYGLLVNQHFVDIKTLQNTDSFQQEKAVEVNSVLSGRVEKYNAQKSAI